MNHYNYLLSGIAKDLSIKQGDKEATLDYHRRLIYSAVGRIMLASLYDHVEPYSDQGNNIDPALVSLMHVKNKTLDVLEAYRSMYPGIPMQTNSEKLIQYMYRLYELSGNLYHKAYYAAPVAFRSSINKRVKLFRGLSLHYPVRMSGLGIWKPADETDQPDSIREMFGLSELSLHEQWKELMLGVKWEKSELRDGLQYLSTKEYTKGYWKGQPDQNNAISIARIGMPGTENYYFYRMESAVLYLSQIPAWRLNEKGIPSHHLNNPDIRLGQYSIMNACLYAHKTLPPIYANNDGNIVHLHIGYILPPAENALIQLYSWPASISNKPDHFKRIMCTEVYHALKPVYEQIGFQFKEETL